MYEHAFAQAAWTLRVCGCRDTMGLQPLGQPRPARVRSRRMGTDARTPVIVGAGQYTNRTNEGADPLSPVDLMLEATAAADRVVLPPQTLALASLCHVLMNSNEFLYVD